MSNLSTLLPPGGGMTLLSRTVIDVSGNFVKDPKAKLLKVICMGGGGGGATGAGSNVDLPGLGGEREVEWFAASLVPSPIAVTIGAGGATSSSPTAGGNTSFGSLLVATGAPINTTNYIGSLPARKIKSPCFTHSFLDSNSRQTAYTIDEGAYLVTVNAINGTSYHSWAGNRGGTGGGQNNFAAFTSPGGRCYPDPLLKGIVGDVTGVAVPGIGDYPGSGGGYNNPGGFPSGGGGCNAAGAAGRVIVYQYG